MELLTDAPAHHFVPDKYVFPPEKRPDLFPDDDSPSVAFPVIDIHPDTLSDERRRCSVAAEIIQAGKEFGFLQMEIITNGLLASVEHCVVTNTTAARLSVATLITPKMECRIGLAPEMVDEVTNPAKYREFMEAYAAADASRERVLESFKIHH
ncbi:uncharacterized protein [Aegilops tauschii subsp. strangulata]|uniref:Non-haem dioxygenase N-terminal domain-containing protein n=1 Tax=Aegilops tauschii TaxID=37682 RepID=M8BCK4_AEGTA